MEPLVTSPYVFVTVLSLLGILADGCALRCHRRAVDIFPAVANALRWYYDRADCVALLEYQARLALRSAVGRVGVLACIGLLLVTCRWQGWGGTPLYAGLTTFGAAEVFFLVQVLDLARGARALARDLDRRQVA